MKYYWMYSNETIKELTEDSYNTSKILEMFTWGKSLYHISKNKNIIIGGDGRFEIDYFKTLVNKFLENDNNKSNI